MTMVSDPFGASSSFILFPFSERRILHRRVLFVSSPSEHLSKVSSISQTSIPTELDARLSPFSCAFDIFLLLSIHMNEKMQWNQGFAFADDYAR